MAVKTGRPALSFVESRRGFGRTALVHSIGVKEYDAT